MVEGEMLIGEGNLDGGFAELRAAVKDEDALRYDETTGMVDSRAPLPWCEPYAGEPLC
jgi:hypothetical protein